MDQALKLGGHFILDVTTHERRNQWYVAENGFWSLGLHLILEQGFDYPELSIFLDQVIVAERIGGLSVYRMWFQDYTRESIIDELEGGLFVVRSVWSDLLGTPFRQDSQWIGIVAKKPVQYPLVN